jgi:hypothetical protein
LVTATLGRELRAVGDVLLAPSRTFRELRDRRPLLAPWLVVSGLSLVLTWGVASVSERALQHLTQGVEGAPELGPLRWLSVAVTPATVFLRWCAIAAVLWAPGALLSAAVTYRGVLSVVAYSSVPGVLGKGIDLAVTWSRGPELSAELVPRFGSATSVGALFPAIGESPWTAAALEQLGFFSLWTAALWVIGLRESYRWSSRKAVGVAAPVWACFWIVATAMEVVGRSLLASVRAG